MKLAAIPAAVALLVSLAHAGELRQQASLDLELEANGSRTATLSVPRFPAALGDLQSVTLFVTLDARNDLGVENTLNHPLVVDRILDQFIQVGLPGGPQLAVMQLHSQNFSFLPAFDGYLNYGGASGESASLRDRKTQKTILAPGPEFIGTTSDALLTFQVDGFSSLSFTGTEKFENSLRSHTGVTVEVVYSY